MATSRRSFLCSVAASAGAAAASRLAGPRRARRHLVAGEPLRLMVIGVGGRGGGNLNGVKDQDIRYLCDIDGKRLKKAGEQFGTSKLVADFREILTSKERCAELDGVVISTPDHTHYLPAMLAIRNGLDVYCEKPLTHTVAQARALTKAAQEHGAVTQMGIQIHANENYRRVVEAVRGGAVGTVRKVIVFVNGTDWSAAALPEEAKVPGHVDYDVWLGPAAEQPFRQGFHPAGWRRYWAFGGGTTADMGCHFMDLAFWALELDAPRTVQAGSEHPVLEHCAPRGLHCRYEFAARGDRAAVEVVWHGGKDRPRDEIDSRGLQKWRNGVLFIGDDGWLISDYSKHEVGPAERAAQWQAPEQSIASSPGHYTEWLQCCRERTQPTCSFAYGGPLTETVLLANAAFRGALGKKLAWDAQAMRFDDDAANAFLSAPERAAFSI